MLCFVYLTAKINNIGINTNNLKEKMPSAVTNQKMAPLTRDAITSEQPPKPTV